MGQSVSRCAGTQVIKPALVGAIAGTLTYLVAHRALQKLWAQYATAMTGGLAGATITHLLTRSTPKQRVQTQSVQTQSVQTQSVQTQSVQTQSVQRLLETQEWRVEFLEELTRRKG